MRTTNLYLTPSDATRRSLLFGELVGSIAETVLFGDYGPHSMILVHEGRISITGHLRAAAVLGAHESKGNEPQPGEIEENPIPWWRPATRIGGQPDAWLLCGWWGYYRYSAVEERAFSTHRVVSALAGVDADDHMRALAVVGEARGLWTVAP